MVDRIRVVGAAGSGKTTMAAALAAPLGITSFWASKRLLSSHLLAEKGGGLGAPRFVSG